MVCEKCWADAFNRSYITGRDQSDCYQELLTERKDKPCTPRQQAGDYWDKENQWDTRIKIEGDIK